MCRAMTPWNLSGLELEYMHHFEDNDDNNNDSDDIEDVSVHGSCITGRSSRWN